MSFESNLAKKKKRKGIRRIVIGIIIPILFSYIFIPWDGCRSLTGVVADCMIYAGIAGLGIIIGLILIIVGAINIAERNRLSKKEFEIKKEIDKDEKIKELEKRLEKVEDDKNESKNDSSKDKNEN